MDNDDPMMMVMVVVAVMMAMVMVPVTDHDHGVAGSGLNRRCEREANKGQQDKGQGSFHNCKGFTIKCLRGYLFWLFMQVGKIWVVAVRERKHSFHRSGGTR
jgi:hypothetical protein